MSYKKRPMRDLDVIPDSQALSPQLRQHGHDAVRLSTSEDIGHSHAARFSDTPLAAGQVLQQVGQYLLQVEVNLMEEGTQTKVVHSVLVRFLLHQLANMETVCIIQETNMLSSVQKMMRMCSDGGDHVCSNNPQWTDTLHLQKCKENRRAPDKTKNCTFFQKTRYGLPILTPAPSINMK